MPRAGKRLLAAVAVLVCTTLCQAAPSPTAQLPRTTPTTPQAGSWPWPTARAGRLRSSTSGGARISVFEAGGRLIGSSAVLLGIDPGDASVPGIAQRSPASLGPGERTTPAGRFDSQPGHNDKGEDIVWIDYAASLAIHRLRPAPPHQRRAQRLDSPTSDDNRASLGCVVVPVAFYESVVRPSLGQHRGVVYVLPESSPVQAMFGAVQVSREL